MSSDANECGPLLCASLWSIPDTYGLRFRPEFEFHPCRSSTATPFPPKVRHAGAGSYVDGNGLMLRVRDGGSRSWVQCLMVHGRRVDIGLGSAELVSLLRDARRVRPTTAPWRAPATRAARGRSRSRRRSPGRCRRPRRCGTSRLHFSDVAEALARWTATRASGAACSWRSGSAS